MKRDEEPVKKVIAFPASSNTFDPLSVVQHDLKKSSVSSGTKLRAIQSVVAMENYDELSTKDMMGMIQWFLDTFDFEVTEDAKN
jgi:hypothetical protein